MTSPLKNERLIFKPVAEKHQTKQARNCDYYLIIILLALTMFAGCTPSNRTVLLTGYWPPTNEMLRPFSADASINPNGWQGKNWQNSGYDVYAYFPEFPGGTDINPKGTGDFEVDYQDTLADFERITQQLKPAIIVSYGRGGGPWEIEVSAPWHQQWHDDYLEPTQPQPWMNGSEEPVVMRTTLPIEQIQKAIEADVSGLKVWIDDKGDPGNFLCGYLAFLAMQYQSEHNHCKAAGFIHIGASVDIETAVKANKAVLKTIIQK